MLDYDFHRCKCCRELAGAPKYRLGDGATVYVCSGCGFHYIDYLDDVQALSSVALNEDAARRHFEYIETTMHHSAPRFAKKVSLVAAQGPLVGARCLDIGAGGGLFLHLLQERGALVHGIEPDPANSLYAREKFGLHCSDLLVEDAYWQEGFRESFDVVTLWDVVEHANFPVEMLKAAMALVKPSGLLCLDTPIRDALFHRFGEATYRLSGGRHPTLLNLEYSNAPFAHKQIFSSGELRKILEGGRFEVVSLEKVHELSFPCASYLERFVRPKAAVRLAEPFVSVLFSVFRVRNKALAVARKGPG